MELIKRFVNVTPTNEEMGAKDEKVSRVAGDGISRPNKETARKRNCTSDDGSVVSYRWRISGGTYARADSLAR